MHTPVPVEGAVLPAIRACCASVTFTLLPQPGSITRTCFSGGYVLRGRGGGKQLRIGQ